jgi:BMFP domain-containing protein YqiC
MKADDGLYAYGVVDTIPERLALVGIDKRHAVYPVVKGDIGVMVSKINIDQFQNQVKHLVAELSKGAEGFTRDTEAMLQAHEDVLVALMQDTTVIPLKFGTILQDEKAALKMLQEQGEQFKNLLAKFAGKVEWGLKVYVDKQAYSEYIIQNEQKFKDWEQRLAKLSRGAAYIFGRKMQEELEEYINDQLSIIAQEIFQDLGQDASEAKLNDILQRKVTGREQEMILNAAYLVAKHKADHLRQRGTDFIQKYAFMALDLSFSGPWPPYNFTI